MTASKPTALLHDAQPLRRTGLIAGFTLLHALLLVGVGFARIEPPMALETINLDLVAQGVPVPEPASTAAEAEAEPEPEKVESLPPIEAPPPPLQEAKAAEALPKPPPKKAKPTPPKKTRVAETAGKTKNQASASMRTQRVGLANGRAQDTGMSKAAYGALVIAQIQARKFYPPAARERGVKGLVGVTFRIGAGGSASSVAVTSSSGSSLLDSAAAQIVRSVRLPPPPGGSFAGSTRLSFSIAR